MKTVDEATDESVAGRDAATAAEMAGQQPTDLLVELEEARREATENYQRYLRAHADMENYKKRIERTYADLARNTKKELLLKLLTIKDNIERALAYGDSEQQSSSESVIQGIRLTEYQLDQMLRAEGVLAMDLDGKPFDPQQAEAVSTVVDPDVPDHAISQVVQQGYLYQDNVLRPAKVVVAVTQPGEGL